MEHLEFETQIKNCKKFPNNTVHSPTHLQLLHIKINSPICDVLKKREPCWWERLRNDKCCVARNNSEAITEAKEEVVLDGREKKHIFDNKKSLTFPFLYFFLFFVAIEV